MEVGHRVTFQEVSWDPFGRDDLSPLTIYPDSSEAGLKRLPDGCGGLVTLSGLPLEGGIDLVQHRVNLQCGGTERQANPSDSPSQDRGSLQGLTIGIGPLDSLGPLDDHSQPCVMTQGAIQALSGSRVTRGLESSEQPVPAYRD